MTMTAHEILKAAVGFDTGWVYGNHDTDVLWDYAIKLIEENTSLREALQSMTLQFLHHYSGKEGRAFWRMVNNPSWNGGGYVGRTRSYSYAHGESRTYTT